MSSEAQQFKTQGNAAFSAGDNAEAVKCFTRAIELDANDHVFFSNRSAAYAAMGDYEAALRDAEACVSLAPQWAKGYSRQGLALFNLKKYEDAKNV
jgi:stress-induced-phosphoprotein 1